MKSKCKVCGEPTSKPYYKLCLDCWKDEQEGGDSTSITIQILTAQVKYLQTSLDEARNQHTGLPWDLKRKLRQLCHPDKHGGSKLATEVFIALGKL